MSEVNRVDSFYPISDTMQSVSRFWEIGMVVKLADHRQRAKQGDRDAESRLCNRLGQLRRNVPTMKQMSPNLQEEIRESVQFLRSIGRRVDFMNPNPAYWITTRSGKPRW